MTQALTEEQEQRAVIEWARLSRLYSESSLELLCASLSYMGLAVHPARHVSVDPAYLKALKTVAKEEIRP